MNRLDERAISTIFPSLFLWRCLILTDYRLGNLAWTGELEWPGHKAYKKAPLDDLTLASDGTTKIGSVKSSGNFTFMRLHAGGHMVPYDQPVASLEMLNRWLSGEWVEA
jgi:cathepsin A (carboxypeptidase C)